MINENLSKTELEICTNFDFKVEDVQRDLMPMIYNVIVKELKNLQTLINDDDFLRDWLKDVSFFGRELSINDDGDFVFKRTVFSDRRLLDITPKQFFGNRYNFNKYSIHCAKREYLSKNDLLNFFEIIEDCKADYIREIKELEKLESEILEICKGCE